MEETHEQIGFAKFTGKLVEDGHMDARKSAKALLGFDAAVRFYLQKQNPSLEVGEFEFPVKIEKGSWMIVVGGAAVVVLTTYATTAAKTMAANDFKDVGMQDVLKKSIQGIQSMIRLGKHLGDLTIKKFDDVKFIEGNELVGIKNSEGEYLYVSKEQLELYVSASPALLRDLTEVIEEERQLIVGVVEDGEIVEETISVKHRQIFTQELIEVEPEILPELKHGERVVLEAEITRGNEKSNTIGIGYGGHIITGYPGEGSIVKYKSSLFLYCRVEGIVFREFDSNRPKIVVDKIRPIPNGDKNRDLFNDT